MMRLRRTSSKLNWTAAVALSLAHPVLRISPLARRQVDAPKAAHALGESGRVEAVIADHQPQTQTAPAQRQHHIHRSIPGVSMMSQCVPLECGLSCMSSTPPFTESKSSRLNSRTSVLQVVLVMIFSINPARAIRRCTDTGVALASRL